jgi:MFS family permease
MGVMAWTLGAQAAHAAPQPLKTAAAALAVMLTLMAGNILDASIPINVTYTHAAVFSVLAIVLSEGAPKSAFRWRRGGALACAVAAAFGSGVGLALWPVMAWGALRRRDWSWLATVLVCGAVFVGLYLSGQGSGGAEHASVAARHEPWKAAVLALSFITLPWTRIALPVAWIGGALIVAASVAIILIKGGPRARPVERIACGLILFTLGAAAMAGLGRTGATDPYNVPLRYALLVTPLHVGLLMLAAPYLGALWRRNRRLAQALCLSVLLATFAQDVAMAAKVVRASDVIRNTVADFHAGLRTPPMLIFVHPDLAFAEAISDQLSRDDLFQHELHLKPRPPAR